MRYHPVGWSKSFNAVRFLYIFLLVVWCAGCAEHHAGPAPAAAPVAPSRLQAVNPADWGPAYVPGMEFGPGAEHLSQAFAQAEAFLAKQPFATQFARRACSGGGERVVDVHFALLADSSGRTLGTVRVDTHSGECSWLGSGNR
jgi:hypothetical protein